MKRAKTIAVVTLLVLVVIVGFQNTDSVETKLLFMTLTMPRVFLLLLTLAIGILIGLLMGSRIGRSKT